MGGGGDNGGREGGKVKEWKMVRGSGKSMACALAVIFFPSARSSNIMAGPSEHFSFTLRPLTDEQVLVELVQETMETFASRDLPAKELCVCEKHKMII